MLDRSLLDHAAEARRLTISCLAGHNFGRRVEERRLVPKAPHCEQHCSAHRRKRSDDEDKALVLGFHFRLSAAAAASARRIDTKAQSRSAIVSATANP
jgi:hypothetical protein